MANVRKERASSEVLKALSYIVQNKINNPRLKGEFITLTYADVSADFRHCKVGFSVLSGNKHKVQEILQKSEGYIKRELLSMVKLPFVPALEFIIDIGEDNSEAVNKILSTLEIPPIEEESSDDEI